MSKTIHHEYTENIVCPWCGNEWEDSCHESFGSHECIDETCDECGEVYFANRNMSVSYSTEKGFDKKYRRDGIFSLYDISYKGNPVATIRKNYNDKLGKWVIDGDKVRREFGLMDEAIAAAYAAKVGGLK